MGGGVSIGTVYGVLELRDTFSSSLQIAAQRMGVFEKSAMALGEKMQRVGTTMSMAFTAPMIAIGTVAVKTFTEFSKQMNLIEAVMQPTAAEMKNLEKAAVDMGKATVFSATEAASALAELGKAGLSSQDAIKALPSTLQLATAANIGLADAASLTANTMSTFGLEVSELGHANDILTKAVNSSTIDITDLRESLKYVGPIARTTGTSLAEVSAAAALLGSNGIKGSMAGTALRNVLTELINPATKTQAIMKQLGIDSFESGGKVMKLADVIGLLKERGVTTAQVMTMFGDRAGPAMAALLTQGSDALKKMTADLEDSEGVAKRASDTMLKGLSGTLERLSGNLETAGIKLGQTLAPAIGKIADIIGGLADLLTNVLLPAFDKLPDPIKLVASGFTLLLIAIGPVALIISQIWKAVAQMAGAVGGLSKLMPGWVAQTEAAAIANAELALAAGAASKNVTALGAQQVAPTFVKGVQSASTVVGGFSTATGAASATAAGFGLSVAKAGTQAGAGAAAAAGGIGLMGRALGFLAGPWGQVIIMAALYGPLLYQMFKGTEDVTAATGNLDKAYRDETQSLANALESYKKLYGQEQLSAAQKKELKGATDLLAGASGLSAEAFNVEMNASDTLTKSFEGQIRMRKQLYAEGVKNAQDAAAAAAQVVKDTEAQLATVQGGKGTKFVNPAGPASAISVSLTDKERSAEAIRLNALLAEQRANAKALNDVYREMAGLHPVDQVISALQAAKQLNADGTTITQGHAKATADLVARLADLDAKVKDLTASDRANIDAGHTMGMTAKEINVEYAKGEDVIQRYLDTQKQLTKVWKESDVAKLTKDLGELNTKLQGAEAAGLGADTILERFDTQLQKIVVDAAAAGVAVPASVAKWSAALDKVNLDKVMKHISDVTKELAKEHNTKFWKDQIDQADDFGKEVVKTLDMLVKTHDENEDAIAKRTLSQTDFQLRELAKRRTAEENQIRFTIGSPLWQQAMDELRRKYERLTGDIIHAGLLQKEAAKKALVEQLMFAKQTYDDMLRAKISTNQEIIDQERELVDIVRAIQKAFGKQWKEVLERMGIDWHQFTEFVQNDWEKTWDNAARLLGAVSGLLNQIADGIEDTSSAMASFVRVLANVANGLAGATSALKDYNKAKKDGDKLGMASAGLGLATMAIGIVFAIKDEMNRRERIKNIKKEQEQWRELGIAISKAQAEINLDTPNSWLTQFSESVEDAGGVTIYNLNRISEAFTATLLRVKGTIAGVDVSGVPGGRRGTPSTDTGQDAIRRGAPAEISGALQAAAQEINELFPQITAALLETGQVASSSFSMLLKTIQELGIKSKAVIDFVTQQSKRAGAAIIDVFAATGTEYTGLADKIVAAEAAVVEARKKGTSKDIMKANADLMELYRQQATGAKNLGAEVERLGVFVLATFNAGIKSGLSFNQALAGLIEPIKRLTQLQRDLGITEDNPAIRALQIAATVAGTAAGQAAAGLNEMILALSNIGALTQETFNGVQGQLAATYTRVQAEVAAAGGGTKEALQQVLPSLQSIIDASKEYGFTIDENTQALIDQAVEHGLMTGEASAGIETTEEKLDRMTSVMVLAFESLITALGGTVPAALAEMARAAELALGPQGVAGDLAAIPRDIDIDVNARVRTTGDQIPEGSEAHSQGGLIYRASGGTVYAARGLFRPRGTDTVPAMLSEGEFVVRRDAVRKVGAGFLAGINAGGSVGHAAPAEQAEIDYEALAVAVQAGVAAALQKTGLSSLGSNVGRSDALDKHLSKHLPNMLERNPGGVRTYTKKALGQDAKVKA